MMKSRLFLPVLAFFVCAYVAFGAAIEADIGGGSGGVSSIIPPYQPVLPIEPPGIPVVAHGSSCITNVAALNDVLTGQYQFWLVQNYFQPVYDRLDALEWRVDLLEAGGNVLQAAMKRAARTGRIQHINGYACDPYSLCYAVETLQP